MNVPILRIRGEDGEMHPVLAIRGEKGESGDTPVKGTDYWTAEDQAAIVADVIAALADGDEVMY